MTRKEYTEHYADIVHTVFAAEEKLQPQLADELKAGKISPRKYCLRIAEEILSKTSDEELERL